MRRAKIVCTLGPSTNSPERLHDLVAAGMDIARFNLSHGSYDDHAAVYAAVRRASDVTGRAVGILVDGGIVVVEYADRKMAEGMAKGEAFAAAGKRMFWPVLNGTLTTLCAFLPFLFWNSIPGKFMSYLPITLFFVLGSSIFIALIFTPALGSIFGKHSD